MATYGKYKVAIISKAEYDSEGVGYSTVMEDFPMALGPLAVFDQIDIQMKPWGRDPATGLPLFINEANVDRWTSAITQDGIVSLSAFATPAKDTIPGACIVIAQVTDNIPILSAIDGHNKHRILGIDNPDLTGDSLPPALQPFDFDVTFPPARWTVIRNGLVTLGMNPEIIDDWKTDNPDATPRQFGKAFNNFIIK